MIAICYYNPGTSVQIQVSREVQSTDFRRCWCEVKHDIDGWPHARPLISFDATFIKGKYDR